MTDLITKSFALYKLDFIQLVTRESFMESIHWESLKFHMILCILSQKQILLCSVRLTSRTSPNSMKPRGSPSDLAPWRGTAHLSFYTQRVGFHWNRITFPYGWKKLRKRGDHSPLCVRLIHRDELSPAYEQKSPAEKYCISYRTNFRIGVFGMVSSTVQNRSGSEN